MCAEPVCKVTLDLEECAEYLKIDISTASTLAAEGILPGAKIGRRWVFPLVEISDYLRAEVKRQQLSRQSKNSNNAEKITTETPQLNKALRARKTTLSEKLSALP